jgi:hypothetical protein
VLPVMACTACTGRRRLSAAIVAFEPGFACMHPCMSAYTSVTRTLMLPEVQGPQGMKYHSILRRAESDVAGVPPLSCK